MEPIVLQFQGFVTDLNTVEKRNIVALTEIARDALKTNPNVASYLAQIVINRIIQAPVDAKLPALYLLDSITKNVGEPYKSLFGASLPEAFGNAWISGAPGLHKPLEKLLNTWNGIFTPQVLEAIKSRKFNAPPTTTVAIPTSTAPRRKPMTQDPRLHIVPTPQPAYNIQPQQPHVAYPSSSLPQQQPPAQTAALLPSLLSLIASSTAASQQQQQQQQTVPPVRTVLQDVQQQNGKGVSVFDNPPSVEFKNEKIKENNPAAIERLLAATEKTKSLFLDRKFLRKQQQSSTSSTSTQWYVDIPTWLASATGGKVESKEERTNTTTNNNIIQPTTINTTNTINTTAVTSRLSTILATMTNDPSQPRPSVAVDDEQTYCALSGERFEQFWDEDHQEWRYKDAVQLTHEEAASYGLEDGAIVLVSALGSGVGNVTAMQQHEEGKIKRGADDVFEDGDEKEAKRVKLEASS